VAGGDPVRVLILGGGGTLGAFSAGALRAIEEQGWAPDAVIGSSAGGINLLRASAGGSGVAARFWTGLRWPTLLREALADNPFNGGVLAEEKFYARVEDGVDFEALLRDRRTIAFLVVDLQTGRVALRGNRTEGSAEALRLVSRAAYALPPLLPPVRLGGALHADGGLLYNAPLDRAAALGATEIIYVCNVQVLPFEGYARPHTLPATLRYLDVFFRRASNVGFADAVISEGAWRDIPFLTIAPPAAPGLRSIVAALRPTRAQMQRLVGLGYSEALSAFAQWRYASPAGLRRLPAGRAAGS
jgi:NTE family protein